jgi:hypothetical protein
MTPLERVEALFDELVTHYSGGDDREVRAAAKLLLVAIAKLREHGGPRWVALVTEYLNIAAREPERFELMLRSNRGVGKLDADS